MIRSLVLTALLLAATSTMFAAEPDRCSGARSQEEALAARTIVGTFNLVIMPDGGDPFPGFTTFHADGTAFFSSAGPPLPALGNPGHGVWTRTGPNTFRGHFEQMTFDPSFQLNGSLAIDVTVHMDADGNGYDGEDHVAVYDLDGNVLFEGGGTSRGTRMRVAGGL